MLALLEAQLASLVSAHRAAREGATHEEAKPEHDKDTRAIEQSYLARGQAARIEELQDSVAAVSALQLRDFDSAATVALGALVTLEEDDAELRLWLAPGGGGTKLNGGVQVVTPKSPLGQALLGKLEGDDVEVPAGGKRRLLTIVRVE